ncbi:glycosyltransferase [Bacteroides sp.]|nr:glycosyltransferase [Bacteroides sp.]
MRLLFNLEVTQPRHGAKRHGGGKYGEVIFKRIVERNLPMAACYDSRKWLNPVVKELAGKYGVMLYDIAKQNVKDIVRENGFTRIFLPLEDYSGLASIEGCEAYGTIHGLRALELKYDSYMKRYASLSFYSRMVFLVKRFCPKLGYKHARDWFLSALHNDNFRFVMVSHHSANTMHAYFPRETAGRDIPVFYSPSTSTDRELTQKYSDKYYLMVSGNRWEKNVLRGIEAFDRLFSAGYLGDAKVRITGVKSADMYRYKIENPKRFEFCGYVDDDELDQLYHDAYAFVYPSANEGFGYPPLEAMHYGVPALVSAHTSISEVCEGGALFFNPFSIEEIMARILSIDDEICHSHYSLLAKAQYIKVTERQKRDLDAVINFIFN